MDSLKVIVKNNSSGKIIYENNEYIYRYNSTNKNDFISLTMPVRAKEYLHNELHPIFEMHLPEGYLLSIIKKHFSKIVKTDDFGLLKIMSPSIKGRLEYEGNSTNTQTLTLDDILHPKDDTLFEELVSKFALHSALSGVQPKVLATIENKATLRLDEYIIKSWGDEYKELSLNEYYCMQIVKNANIPVPEFYISDDDKLFIMKRFDIKDDGSYLGFEDMCVLMAKQRDDKYEGTYEQIAKVIKTFVSPKNKKTSFINFFKMIVINYLVKNGDAHLKNFGLIYDGVDDISLAPAYDVVSTTIYIKNDIPALNLLGSKKWWDKKYIHRFGIENCDLTKKEVTQAYGECIDSIKIVSQDIQNRLKKEYHQDKKDVLTLLLDTIKPHLMS
jgi:serine/threonine-protein kinase HipA